MFPWNRRGFQQHKDPAPAKNSAISCVLLPKKRTPFTEWDLSKKTPSWKKPSNWKIAHHLHSVLQRIPCKLQTNRLAKRPKSVLPRNNWQKKLFRVLLNGLLELSGGKRGPCDERWSTHGANKISEQRFPIDTYRRLRNPWANKGVPGWDAANGFLLGGWATRICKWLVINHHL